MSRYLLGIIIALIAIFLIVFLLFIFPRPTATVTLTADSKPLSNTTHASVVAFPLYSAPQASQTGTSSGQPKPGVQATGSLTFKNYTPSEVTIPKGTVLTDVTGQQVVTDESVLVPPDPPIIPGVASVRAHAVKAGQNGNIQAMSIDKPCCFSGIRVSNSSAFSGGLDPQAAHVIQASDVESIAKALQSSLLQKAQSGIQSQLKPGQQLVNTTPSCSAATVTAKPRVGESAEKFTVDVSLKCSGLAYDPTPALQQAKDALLQQAQGFGSHYVLAGDITTTIGNITPGKDKNMDVQVLASGLWKYQFSAAEKTAMARHIARMLVTDAKAWLSQQTGVKKVDISVTGPIIDLSQGKYITDDVRAITING